MTTPRAWWLCWPRRTCSIDPGRPDLVDEVEAFGTGVLGRAAPRLAAAFGTSPAPFVLMLDDLHELQSPACHDVLGLVLARVPPGSQVVAASRSEQPHLARLTRVRRRHGVRGR